MRFAPASTAILVALMVTPAAHAARSEIVVSAGMIAPATSDYRFSAEVLGYGRRNIRSNGEAELGFLVSPIPWLSLGPLARLHAGSMGSPYGGVPAIETWGGSLAARAEVDVFTWPRLFLWLDPSLGLGSIGVPNARKTVVFPGFRAGIGVGMAHKSNYAVRVRAGWAYAPTLTKVTETSGTYDFGGFVLQLDGVFHVGG